VNPRQHCLGVVFVQRLQPVHVFQRVLAEERRVGVSGHVLVHPGIDVHAAKRLEVGFGVQRIAVAQRRCDPAAADVKHLAFDAQMRPERHGRPTGCFRPHLDHGVGQRKRPASQREPAFAVAGNDARGRKTLKFFAPIPRPDSAVSGRTVREPKPASTQTDGLVGFVGNMNHQTVRRRRVAIAKKGNRGKQHPRRRKRKRDLLPVGNLQGVDCARPPLL